MARIIAQIRRRWPKVRILLRADSGFAPRADGVVRANGVDYVFGLARNSRLLDEIKAELAQAEGEHRQTDKPARRFKDFAYATLDSWSRPRRVTARAEHLDKGSNPALHRQLPERHGGRRQDPV